MSEKPWYEEWFNSPYYHQLYFNKDENEARAIIESIIARLSPPPGARMLDVACGKGRHSRILASLGFDVTGLDLAPDSISEAKKWETDHLHFYLHDMRLPYIINYFDYAFNFFTSFGYFRTRRENENFIRTIADALKEGAYLVMDYLNVHYAETYLRPREYKEIDGIGFYLTRWFDEDRFYKKIEVEDENRTDPYIIVERVSKFTLGDFIDMFAFHGIQVQDVFGDYQFQPYDVKNSPRLLMIARKMN